MLTVLAEFTDRTKKEQYIEDLRQWAIVNNILLGETLLGVSFVAKDTDAVNLAEKLLFSRKFPGLTCILRETKAHAR
jgi:hypothetical protein